MSEMSECGFNYNLGPGLRYAFDWVHQASLEITCPAKSTVADLRLALTYQAIRSIRPSQTVLNAQVTLLVLDHHNHLLSQ